MKSPDSAVQSRLNLHQTARSGAGSVARRKDFNDAILSDRSFTLFSIALFVIAIVLLFASTTRAATPASLELSLADEWWGTAFFLDTSADLTSADTSQTQSTSISPLPPDPAAPAATFTWDGNGSGNSQWSNGGNWVGDVAPPTTGADIVFAGILKLTPSMQTSYSIISLSFAPGAGAFNLTSTGSNTLTIGSGGITNSSSNVQTIATPLILSAAQTWNGGAPGLIINSTVNLGAFVLTIDGTGTNALNGIISSTTAGNGLTKNGIGTTILKAGNTYNGDTVINAGDLRFDNGGKSNSSTIRLGATSGTDLAVLSLGGANVAGNNLASPLEVRSGSSGTKILRQLDNTGTNTYSGVVTLNAGLTLESQTGGTLLFQGGSIDVKTNTLTVDTQVYNSGTLNGANSAAMQGNVIINEVLGSSLATGGSLVKDGGNTLILQGTSNTYTGTNAAALNPNGTTIKDGVLGIYGDGSLGLAPSTATDNIFFTASTLGAATQTPTLQDTANNVTLAATRNINVAGGTTARFDSNGNTFTINGVINGSGNINKIGAGTLVLNGNNIFTGSTTVSAGTLDANANGALGSGTTGTSSITVNSGATLMLSNSSATDRVKDTAPITLAGGTLGRSGPGVVSEGTGAHRSGVTVTGTSSVGLGALTLTSTSTLDFNLLSNGGVGTLTFSSFTPNANTLNIIGYISSANFATLTSGTDGVDDRLIFNSDQTANLAFFNFNGIGATQIPLDLGFFEVVPVPEPSTWAGASLALVALLVHQRRRLKKLLKKA